MLLRPTTVALLLGCVAGCSGPMTQTGDRNPLGPQATAERARDPRLFYPLDLGNHWRFHRVFTFQGQVIRRSRIDHDQVCVDAIGDREYVVDGITQIDSTLAGPLTFHQWVRARQDPTGLYEADVDIGVPPPCADAGDAAAAMPVDRTVLDGTNPPDVAREAIARVRRIEMLLAGRGSTAAGGELTRLRYPLVVGATWTVRSQPITFTSTVEALESLVLPIGTVPAYRLRIDSEVAGPGDRVVVWYGRSGMLGMLVHVEISADGGPLIAEDVITLEDLAIDRGRF
jgi:hypothetical protein